MPPIELIDSGAFFSPCRQYRYSLWRVWNKDKPAVAFIGLNPSTADEAIDDPTIRRCIGFAKSFGHGGLVMLNLFAFRSTDPKALLKAADPIGPANDGVFTSQHSMGRRMIAAWGVHGALKGRDRQVIAMLPRLECLGCTKGGHPKHPLYLAASTQPRPFTATAPIAVAPLRSTRNTGS